MKASVRCAVDTASDLFAQCKPSHSMEKVKLRWSHLRRISLKLMLILGNSAGNLIRAQAIWYEHAADARAMEAMAVRDGLRLASVLGYTRIMVESDALEVVNLCNSNNYERGDIRALGRQVNDLLPRPQISVRFSFLKVKHF